MQEQRAERGSRGKYARLICQRCRSRKIKCVLPDADGIGPLGVPQTSEKSCERCRSYNLDCVVDRTVLGRPASKRIRQASSQAGNSTTSIELGVPSDGAVYTPSSLEIKDYMYAEAADDGSISETDRVRNASKPTKQEVFHSMIHPAHFLSSILAKDEAFGSCITHATSRMKTSLSDLISDDLAALLDSRLVWHRFFLPGTPTLVDIRHQLIYDESASQNPATNLLFALLCLSAFETCKSLHEQNQHLIRSMHVAVSTSGQEFMFSLPAHRDSVMVCLLLSDYKPTALVSSQSVSHKAVQSGLYVNLAYRMTERLELLPEHFNLNELDATDSFDREDYLLECLRGLQIHCHEAFLDGFITKPLRVMRHAVNRMRSQIQTYQNVLNNGRCSPILIYHIQYITATFIMMEAVLDMKHNWNNLGSLSIMIEETDRKCLEHINASNYSLPDSPDHGNQDDQSTAARSLLEIRFHSVFVFVCSIGIVYATVLRARLNSGEETDPEIRSHEALQIGTQVIDSLKNTSLETNPSVSAFLKHFGSSYPIRLMTILEKFIECAEVLKLNGEAFRPPPRHLILEMMGHCKNLVENNVVQLKAFGRLHPSFETQLDLFAKCTKQLEAMATLPWTSTDAAFASGCLYAAASKVIHGFSDLMEELRTRVSKEDVQEPSDVLEGLADPDTFNGLGFEFSFDGWELWPHVGGIDVFDSLQNQPDWYSALNLFPELES